MVDIKNLSFNSDREIKAYKAQETRYTAKHKTCKGLFLEVSTQGTKSWWYRYTLNGKQERLVIGKYPDISLAEAITKRDEASNQVANGISPKQQKQLKKKA